MLICTTGDEFEFKSLHLKENSMMNLIVYI